MLDQSGATLGAFELHVGAILVPFGGIWGPFGGCSGSFGCRLGLFLSKSKSNGYRGGRGRGGRRDVAKLLAQTCPQAGLIRHPNLAARSTPRRLKRTKKTQDAEGAKEQTEYSKFVRRLGESIIFEVPKRPGRTASGQRFPMRAPDML